LEEDVCGLTVGNGGSQCRHGLGLVLAATAR